MKRYVIFQEKVHQVWRFLHTLRGGRAQNWVQRNCGGCWERIWTENGLRRETASMKSPAGAGAQEPGNSDISVIIARSVLCGNPPHNPIPAGLISLAKSAVYSPLGEWRQSDAMWGVRQGQGRGAARGRTGPDFRLPSGRWPGETTSQKCSGTSRSCWTSCLGRNRSPSYMCIKKQLGII